MECKRGMNKKEKKHREEKNIEHQANIPTHVRKDSLNQSVVDWCVFSRLPFNIIHWLFNFYIWLNEFFFPYIFFLSLFASLGTVVCYCYF